jgi:hypothetical protein
LRLDGMIFETILRLIVTDADSFASVTDRR